MIDLNKIASIKEDLIKKATKYEISMQQRLDKCKVFYEFQYCFAKNDTIYFVDFYFPQYKCYLELDGRYHQETRIYDTKRKAFIEKNFHVFELRLFNGYSLRINNNDLFILLKKFSRPFISNNQYKRKKYENYKTKKINSKIKKRIIYSTTKCNKIIPLIELQSKEPVFKPRINKI